MQCQLTCHVFCLGLWYKTIQNTVRGATKANPVNTDFTFSLYSFLLLLVQALQTIAPTVKITTFNNDRGSFVLQHFSHGHLFTQQLIAILYMFMGYSLYCCIVVLYCFIAYLM